MVIPIANAGIEAYSVLNSGRRVGACETLERIIDFQKTINIQGSEEFVTKFSLSEAARTGDPTVEGYFKYCDNIKTFYNNLEKAWGKNEIDIIK